MTDNAALVTAAEARVAEARAEVDRLGAKLADEHRESAEKPSPLTAADGRAEALRRYPRKAETGTGDAEGEAAPQTGRAAGVAEAKRPPLPVGQHPEPGHDLPVAGALLDLLGRRRPDPFQLGTLLGGQPSTVGIPHGSGIAHSTPPVSSIWHLRRR